MGFQDPLMEGRPGSGNPHQEQRKSVHGASVPSCAVRRGKAPWNGSRWLAAPLSPTGGKSLLAVRLLHPHRALGAWVAKGVPAPWRIAFWRLLGKRDKLPEQEPLIGSFPSLPWKRPPVLVLVGRKLAIPEGLGEASHPSGGRTPQPIAGGSHDFNAPPSPQGGGAPLQALPSTPGDLPPWLWALAATPWPVFLCWTEREGKYALLQRVVAAEIGFAAAPPVRWRTSQLPRLLAAPLGVVLPIHRELAGQAAALARKWRFFVGSVPESWDGQVPSSAQVEAHLASLFPTVSILLPVYGQRELTAFCLQSLFTATDYPSWELVAVDNASPDGAGELLDRWAAAHPRMRVVQNPENLGFPRACNQAASLAQGEIVCVLNNDTVVTPGWLAALVDELISRPEVGLVGPVSNGVANEAQVRCPCGSLEELPLWALSRSQRFFRRSWAMPMLAFFCVATWRRLWEQLGGLDEGFGLGLFEDNDFSFRMRTAGFTLSCRRDAYVHHFQSSSFSRLADDQYLALYEANRRRFLAKKRAWKDRL
jgi:GT2 family glycosyltransferase